MYAGKNNTKRKKILKQKNDQESSTWLHHFEHFTSSSSSWPLSSLIFLTLYFGAQLRSFQFSGAKNAFQNPPLSFFILSSNPLPQYSQTILSPFLSLHPSISLLPRHFLSFLFLPFTSPFLVADSPPIRGSSRSQQPRDWERNWRWSTRKWTIIRNWRRRIGEPRVE